MDASADVIVRLILLGVIAIITIVAAGAFSKRLGVAAPIVLIVVGVGFSFIPGAPVQVPSQVILLGLLPPILYAAALSVPVVELRRNFATISALSVGLVLLSAFVTALLLVAVLPRLDFATALAVGAVISPTDAVAATALGRRLGLPPRLLSILEGEGLVNDAAALVLLRSAISAIAATVSLWQVVGDFAFAVASAVVLGLLVGVATVFIRSRLNDSVLETAISFAVPFIAFLPVQLIGGSGVLAVVVAGLYTGHRGAQHFSPQARTSERLNWRTIQFVLENGVFLVVGVQITSIVSGVRENEVSAAEAVGLGLVVTLVVVLVRFAFMAPLFLMLRQRRDRADRRLTQFQTVVDAVEATAGSDDRRDRAVRSLKRKKTDYEQLRREGLGWRGGVILGWSGMRGVVTLAAAQSLPENVPYRSQLILIAFTVAVVTLLVQGGTLPWIIRALRLRGVDPSEDRQSLATLFDQLAEAGLLVLDNPRFTLPDGQVIDEDVVERVRTDTLRNVEAARERADHGAADEGLARSPERQYRELRREVLQAGREALLDARSAGTYPSRVLSRAQRLIDLEETRLEQLDHPGS